MIIHVLRGKNMLNNKSLHNTPIETKGETPMYLSPTVYTGGGLFIARMNQRECKKGYYLRL